MKLVSGDIQTVLDQQVDEVICTRSVSTMELDFYKAGIFHKNLTITGLGTSAMDSAWAVLQHSLLFAMNIKTELKYV